MFSGASASRRIPFFVPSSPCEPEIPFGPYLQSPFANLCASLMLDFFVSTGWPNGIPCTQGRDVAQEQTMPQKPNCNSRGQIRQTEPRARKGRVVRWPAFAAGEPFCVFRAFCVTHLIRRRRTSKRTQKHLQSTVYHRASNPHSQGKSEYTAGMHSPIYRATPR